MTKYAQFLGVRAVVALVAAVLLTAGAAEREPGSRPEGAQKRTQRIKAFQPGELLSYEVTWLSMRAGTASMEVKREARPDGSDALRFEVISKSAGVVDKLYQLGDTIGSVFDPEALQSLSYSLQAQHGKRTRRRVIAFDYGQRKATMRLNDDPPETVPLPGPVQDPLTALYYLRTQDFSPDKPVKFKALDSDQVSDVEIELLGREHVKTPAGEFDAIKVRARRGFFVSEGEVVIWLTDDERRIPVLLRGKAPLGQIEFALTGMKVASQK